MADTLQVNPFVLRALFRENEIRHDLLLFDVVDSYGNLTSKGFLTMAWIDKHFHNVKYILKTDDDILLNTYEWLCQIHFLEANHCKVCMSCKKHPVLRRRPYPHCKGRGYMLSMGALHKILSEYKLARWNQWEDLFFTGILGYQKGISLHDMVNFSSTAANPNQLANEIYDVKAWENTWLKISTRYQILYENMSESTFQPPVFRKV